MKSLTHHKGVEKMVRMDQMINGVSFRNPVLTAAGPNTGTLGRMLEASQGGAGGIVTKTISVKPAKDPRPTISRSPLQGLYNCETWSERPYEDFLPEYLEIKKTGLPLIVSIGYSPRDVTTLGRILRNDIKPDIIEFSTHYVGKSMEPLLEVARRLKKEVECPVWMKISPDTADVETLAKAAEEYVDAFVAINSFGPVLDFDIERVSPFLGSTYGQGWMSGPPIMPLALRIVYQISRAQSKPVIGVGGIRTGNDAIKFIMAGASLVQICTAALREGPSIYGKVAREMEDWMASHGYEDIRSLRGAYRDRVEKNQ